MIETSSLLSRKERSFLRLAVKLAETSQIEPMKHGCVVVKSGSVIGLGINKNRNQGIEGCELYEYTVHAEMDALSRCREQAEGSIVYVARVNMNNKIGLARPCDMCYTTMKTLGVKKVIYTDME